MVGTFTVRREDGFDFASEEYADLYRRSQATPFQHGAWLTRLYSDLAPIRGVERVVVVARRTSDDALAMVLPMVRRRTGPLRVIEYADLGVADYAAPVVDDEFAGAIEASDSVAGQVRSALGGYDLLRIERVADSPDGFTSLVRGLRSRRHLYGTHTVELAGSVDEWRQRLQPTFTRHLDRKYKRLRPKGELRLRRVDDPAEVDGLMGQMQGFRAARFGGTRTVDLVQDPDCFAFYCSVARAAVAGDLPGSLAALEVGGTVVALAFDLAGHDRDLHLLVGYDLDRLRNYSLGLIIINELIEDAIARGLGHYDLTVGDEPYKADFGAHPRPLYEVRHARTPLGFGADRARQGYLRARRLAKRALVTWGRWKKERAERRKASDAGGAAPVSRAGSVVSGIASRARRVVKGVARRASSAIVGAVGADVSSEFDRRSCLVLAPHPDDETFGCGATIARKRDAGSRVEVVIVTDGGRSPHVDSISGAELVAIREREAVAALACLGVDESDVTFLGFADGTLPDHTREVAVAITPLIRDARADQVLVTSTGDRHSDHEALGNAARIVFDDGDIPGELYEYAIWQRVPAATMIARATRSAWTCGGSLRVRVSAVRPQLVSTEGYLDRKRSAVAAYASQLPLLPVGFVEDFLQRREVFVRVLRS